MRKRTTCACKRRGATKRTDPFSVFYVMFDYKSECECSELPGLTNQWVELSVSPTVKSASFKVLSKPVSTASLFELNKCYFQTVIVST